MKRELPYFSIIGCQRSGSTYLYDILNLHSKVLLNDPPRPEPKYFIGLQSKDIEGSKSTYIQTFFSKLSKGETDYQIFGDKSTSYCEDRSTLINMKAHFPEGKVIMILRNPIYRAISNFKFSASSGLETRTIEEVFIDEKVPPTYDQNQISISPFLYLERGLYSNYIKDVLSVFERENVLFVCFEDLVQDLNLTGNKLTKFLGIDDFELLTKPSNRNKSKMDLVISKEIIAKLSEYYNSDRAKIEELTGLKLDFWKE